MPTRSGTRYARVAVVETVIAAIEDGLRAHGMEPLELGRET